ncbi:hypothetical protein RRG08_029642 [Elysia crispata]|uniref:Uncharacterized protein n=1 Tax=Elysia crispata TaxID=231223 RepID=A0AAE0XPP5_9GAST|nr:hypothetical protein RRG08_029642 [Elysia crispata]
MRNCPYNTKQHIKIIAKYCRKASRLDDQIRVAIRELVVSYELRPVHKSAGSLESPTVFQTLFLRASFYLRMNEKVVHSFPVRSSSRFADIKYEMENYDYCLNHVAMSFYPVLLFFPLPLPLYLVIV